MADDPVKIGDTFGKWRVTRLYDYEGVVWAEIVNTRNLTVTNRCPVTDLARLGG
jgi:hypothetical protein